MSSKPQTRSGYDGEVTDACERVLVTLLRGLGPWKDSVFLVGGLAPRYIVQARPPEVLPHAGTADIDVVVHVEMLTQTEAYQTLEKNLAHMGFERAENDQGQKQSWRWQTRIENGATMIVEFLADSPELSGGKVGVLPTDGNVSALNIPHSNMVFDLHETREVTAELLADGGWTTETVRFANVVSFTCLKTFAFDHRKEPKDAHDLVYCIENFDGGLEAVHRAFAKALEGEHAGVIKQALAEIARRFTDPDPDQAYRRDGPVAVAHFEGGDDGGDPDQRNRRIVRQRRVADLMADFLAPFV